VFEIGRSLREARESRGLELGQVAAVTRIRTSYLAALENEHFEALPGRAYARAFLREYAEFLGLDGQSFLNEFDARCPDVEEQPIAPARLPQPIRLKPYVTTAAGIAAVLLLGLLAWRSGDGERTSTPRPTTLPRRPPAATHAVPAPTTPRPRPRAKLVLNALGRCWLEAHVGSREGRTVFSGILEAGERARFVGRRLWIRLGAPWNLTATLNGKPISLPDRIANVIVTPRGVTEEQPAPDR
jgi:transcriptional regulator with XRE-family HTH domain